MKPFSMKHQPLVHMLMLQEGRPTYSVELVEVLVGVLVDVEELQKKNTFNP